MGHTLLPKISSYVTPSHSLFIHVSFLPILPLSFSSTPTSSSSPSSPTLSLFPPPSSNHSTQSPSVPPPRPPPPSSSPSTPASSSPPLQPRPSYHKPSASSSTPHSPSPPPPSPGTPSSASSPSPPLSNPSPSPSSSSCSSTPPLPDHCSFPFILKACSHLFAFRLGSQIHSYTLKLNFSSDTFIANSLIHFYCSCDFVQPARHLFDEMPNRNQVSWNAMIDGYAATGHYNTALYLFTKMQSQFFMPDVYTIQSLLSASTDLGSLSIEIWVHAFLIKRLDSKVLSDTKVNNSLIDLYSRCGSLSLALQVFDQMPERDFTSWNAMILGLSTHGYMEECFESFNIMLKDDNLRPNSITFVAVLSACAHGGLVKQGSKYFHLFTNELEIEPRLEHYGCLVNMLARAGLVEEAMEWVQRMPCKPDGVIWRSLLDACYKRKTRIEANESMALKLLESDGGADSGGLCSAVESLRIGKSMERSRIGAKTDG